MSCQQASKFSTTFSSVISEDPYVFTDTLPTKTPFLNTQELRAQFLDGDYSKNNTQTKPPPILLTKSKTIHKRQTSPNAANTFANKFAKQDSSCVETETTGIGTGTGTGTGKGTRSRISNNQQTSHNAHMKYEDNRISKLTVSAPIPIFQHTPSLWQTPLLLDTAGTVISPPTSPASLSSSPILTPTSNLIPNSSCGNGNTNNNTNTAALSPSASASLSPSTATAPIVAAVNASTAPLPSSKFHHTTLAQHLKKVQCIKKLKKPTNESPPPLQALTTDASVAATEDVNASKSSTTQHSADAELIDIPVNVIFRKPQQQQQQQQQPQQLPHITSCAPIVNATPAIFIQTTAATTADAVVVSSASSPKFMINATTVVTAPNCHKQAAKSKDVIFIHPKNKADGKSLPTTSETLKIQQKSSIAQQSQQQQLTQQQQQQQQQQKQLPAAKKLQYSTLPNSKTINVLKAEKAPPLVFKRKPTTSTSASIANTAKSPTDELSRIPTNCNDNLTSSYGKASATAKGAVAVIEVLPLAEDDDDAADITNDFTYAVQHELSSSVSAKACEKLLQRLTAKLPREERIAQHKNFLQRQAMHLAASYGLLQPGQKTVRRRFISIDRLLRQRASANCKKPANKQCVLADCNNSALDMASHCVQHLNPVAIQLLTTCGNLLSHKVQCRIPNLLLEKPTATNPANSFVQHKNIDSTSQISSKESTASATSFQPNSKTKNELLLEQKTIVTTQQQQQKQLQPQRKRKTHSHNNTRLQKRLKKVVTATAATCRPLTTQSSATAATTTAATAAATTTTPALHCSNSMQRKNSTTSLESIASNSHSSYSKLQPTITNSNTSFIPNSNSNSTSITTQLPPPALAPLSNIGYRNALNERQFISISAMSAGDLDLKELNQIVAQYADMSATAEHNNNNNNYSNSNFNSLNSIFSNNNNNNSTHIRYNHQHHHSNSSSNSNNSNSIMNSYSNNSYHNQQHHHHHFHNHQDILSISENSSIYASSEDTGLGGLSETELMAGSNDADEIPLGDARLLDEHDLANVLSALPEDAFNELFSSVQQDERDEVERALELADKHLKSLQQTISSDSNFLVDFPDFSDEMLDANLDNRKEITTANALHSPDTSGIDISALLLDNGVHSETDCGTTSSSNCSGDVRGLVQT